MRKAHLIFVTLSMFLLTVSGVLRRPRRSIDLSAAHSLVTESRLPGEIVPNNYTIDIRPIIEESSFTGKILIIMTFHEPTSRVVLHASHDLEIVENEIKLKQIGIDKSINQEAKEEKFEDIPIRRVGKMIKKPQFEIFLKDPVKQGTIASLEINYSGHIWESVDGMFKGGYMENSAERKTYLATHMRPNNARKLFPCFDEPAFKVPMTVSISRPKNMHTLFNTPLKSSSEISETYVVDTFETTPPMSTFTFGFVMSQLAVVERSDFIDPNIKEICIRVYARPDLHKDLQDSRIYERIEKSLLSVQKYFGVDFPLQKLDIVALPNFATLKPVDSWGLIIYKESELTQKSYYLIAQELIYQWLGCWATPFWYSDSHINKAIAGFVATQTALDLDSGAEFEGKWPMTILYSIYYEFSKRYPHSRITGMKQETICSKTELVLRMLNYTIGADTFKKGLQNFIVDREFKTFFVEDVWNALTKQAHLDNKLDANISINDIATSWIQKDRLPTLTIKRDYAKKTAKVSQKVYLRERPHDIEGKDKMLWWIPIIMLSEDNLNFHNTTPIAWLKNAREMDTLSLSVNSNKFIIVNPEEIGPFPVNYDEDNWNMLASYLQTNEGREKIPVYTRSKLLHDSWNLAYAGKLSFATALNMTLFMKSERNHLVWNSIFTFIDHIGRHIDASDVHKKFEMYVGTLLTPLYEELAVDVKENEENWKRNLRSLSKTFLCRAGYKPCVEEAQAEYKKWMDSPNPEEGNPVANQFICPVFKHASMAEFEFGLQRIINFPVDRMQSERTYLLKTLAGCPNQPEKITRLLNVTILEENGNFSENDVFLIFSMLSGGSAGYKTLFHFLKDNWDIIKLKFASKNNLWDNLISSATAKWNVQAGYDLVSQLHNQHQGEFGSAEHIIEKSLKNIKEEAKWSEENLPIIEKWLNDFLTKIGSDVNSKFVK